MNYQLAFDSFIGSRSENQDAILNIKIAEDIFLVGIADGMGGVKGGKLASSLTVESITDYVQSLSPYQFENENLKNILATCYEIAHFCIQKAVEGEPEYAGMGTTLSLLLLCGDNYVWSNIGDSRIYLVQEDEINQLTIDHTYAQQISEGGEEMEEIKGKYDHYLTKCVDGSGELPDIFPIEEDCVELHSSASFLLCSDGLILDKSDTDIDKFKQIVLKSSTVQDAVSDLISYAYTSGSKDNISAGVVWVRESPKPKKKIRKASRKLNWLNFIIYSVLVFLVLISGGIFLTSIGDRDNTTKSVDYVEEESVSTAKWIPLNSVDFQFALDANSDINWLPYPDRKNLKYYHLVVLDNDRLIVDKYLKKNASYFPASELNLKYEGSFTLMLDAIINDNIRIEGNSVSFNYQLEIGRQ